MCSCLLIFPSFYLVAQTSPDDFLGFKVGTDRKLADYEQIRAYFEKLSQESGRLQLTNIGTSTLGKPIAMAVISSEANLAKLDTYREMAKKLKDPRTLSPEDARQLAREGKVILVITCNVHATEIASSQAAMELAFKLATGDTPFDANRILDEVIVLLSPPSIPMGSRWLRTGTRSTWAPSMKGAACRTFTIITRDTTTRAIPSC